MSTTLLPTNKKAVWLPNVAGWTVCGYINWVCEIPITMEGGDLDYACPRPVHEASAKQCAAWANYIIMRLVVSRYASITLKRLHGKIVEERKLFAGSEADLKDYVMKYVEWLRACRGYKTAR